MPRTFYQKISKEDNERLREKHNRDEDFVHLAKLLSIDRTTAYSIVLRDEDEPAHGGKKYQKFDDDMRDYLSNVSSVTLC